MLRKYPADLSPLKRAVGAFLASGVPPRANGDCLPSEGTWGLYEPVKVEALKLLDVRVPYVQGPTVRIKPSPPGGRFDSSILHTDVWSGNPPTFVVMIPIEGDFETGGVEFYKPTKNLDLLRLEYEDYKSVPDFAPEYLGKMEPGLVHIVDWKCLHKTMNGGRRVSVDFRVAYDLNFPNTRNFRCAS